MAKTTVEKIIDSQWDKSIEDFFTKTLPSLPSNIKEILVKYGPWIALVGALLSLPVLIAALGLGAMFSSAAYYWGGMRYGYGYNLAWWISILSMGLSLWALPGLFKRQKYAWTLMFYSALATGLYNLLTFSLGSLVIGLGLSLYVLYQIKSYYK